MVKNAPNLTEDMQLYIKDAKETPKQKKLKRDPHKDTLQSNYRNPKRILKAGKKKWFVTYMGLSLKLTADFVSETMEARKQRGNTFKLMKERKNMNQEFRI